MEKERNSCDNWGTPEYNSWHEAEKARMIREHPSWYDADGNAIPSKAEREFDLEAYQAMTHNPRWW